MLRQLELTRFTTKIQVEVAVSDSGISAYLVRKGDDTIREDLVFESIDGCLATFKLTDCVHMLPFGYYDLVITSCNCECDRFPVHLPKCKTTRPGTCSSNEMVRLPSRECPPCEEDEEIEVNEDMCPALCDNEIEKSEGLNLDWKITQRKTDG